MIEWGNGIYGAEAAARTYFGKSAASLSPQESALLAGGDHQPAAAESRQSDGAFAAASGDAAAQDGRRHTAAGYC